MFDAEGGAMTRHDARDRILEEILSSVAIPDTGLVLRDTHGYPAPSLASAACTKLVHWTDGSPGEPVRASTDEDGHWAVVRQMSPHYWVAAHVNQAWGDEQYVLFASFEDAYAHYEQVVRGQQDASDGRAWRDTDVPGVLAGEDLDLAERAGYTYEGASDQYREDRAVALAGWSMLDALGGP